MGNFYGAVYGAAERTVADDSGCVVPSPDEITRICKEAVKTMLGFSMAHVGINCADEAQAEQTTKTLCALFDLEYKPGNSSIFAGSAVECNKAPVRGANGPHCHRHQQRGSCRLPPGSAGRDLR